MTHRELAQKLGVSPATLSLVINHKPGLSQATRTRVLEQLETLGLQDILRKPDTSTEQSDTAPGNNICFVAYKRHGKILDFSPFFLLIMESVESCAHKHGYNLLFLTIDRRQPIPEQIRRLREMDCAGAIIFATEMLADDVLIFDQLPFPHVILDNDFPELNIDSVAINNLIGTYQAIEHLVQLGHRKIGYLKSSAFINSFGERDLGFRQALARFSLPLEEQFIVSLNYTEEGSYQEFRSFLARSPELPTAFVTDDDTIAAGVMKALSEAGLRVPEDISIVGFNDRPVCDLTNPPMTSIRVPKYAFGAMAIDLLIKRMHDANIRRDAIHSLKYRIGTELVARESTSQPPSIAEKHLSREP